MSKPLQCEHSNSATLSAVCRDMSGCESVALYAHCWEAFVRPRLGQAQYGRFALHDLETSAEFGDQRKERPHVRMRPIVHGSPRPNRRCRACWERGPRWRLRLPSSTASASVNDHSLTTEVEATAETRGSAGYVSAENHGESAK